MPVKAGVTSPVTTFRKILMSHSSKLPLVVAISSCLLAACSSSPTPSNTPTQAVALPKPTQTAQPVPNNYGQFSQPTIDVTPSGNWNEPAQSPLIDPETLALFDDFLSARDMSMVEGDRLAVERYGNLWDRIRRGYKIRPIYHARIEAQKSWFNGRQTYIERLTARASRYLHHTVTEAERRGIPTELALLPIIESSYDPSATSNAQAAGLWQFIPSTGRIYGLDQSRTYDGRRDIIESTRAAYDFLTSLYNQFGSWELALAAYNAGPGRIQRAIDANRAQGLATDYWSLTLPTETMNYVPRFMAVAQIIQDPTQHKVNLPAIANHAHFRTVATNRGVSLQDVSSVTGVSVYELQLLNPALTNQIIDESGPNRVVIPNSVSTTLDKKILALAGNGQGGLPTQSQKASFIAPANEPIIPNSRSTELLQSNNTLPTTTAQITANNTIKQEPPLSDEERNFIAEQIRLNSPEPVQPINPKDGNIDLNAIQTAQSVLENKQQSKTVSFDANTTLVGIGTTSGSQTVAPNRPAPNNATTHTIQPKDTLSSIALQYNVTIAQLREWNQMGTDSTLYIGNKLKIVAPTTNPARSTAPKPRSDSHIVQPGDTLTDIASKYGLTLSQLTNYNNISINATIIPNQKLWLVDGKTTKQTSSTRPSNKPTTYRVQAGDTLTALANRFGTTREAIAELNSFGANDGLREGTTINLPNASTQANSTAGKDTQQRPAKATTYTIQSGDTLTRVAARHNLSISELAAANNLSETAGLIAGNTLTIPSNAPRGTAAPATQSQGKAIAKTENYTVKAGDTLTSLANQYGVSVADLAKTNNLASNARLSINQTIKVPKLTTTYKVKSGESLNSIAKRYGISTDELARMNNLKPNDGLKINQVLTVPNQ